MHYTTYIFVTLILVYAGFTYYRYFTKKSVLQNDDYALQNGVVYSKEILKNFLTQEHLLAPLKAKFVNEEIEAITQCIHIKDIQSIAKNVAVETAKKLMWRMVGFKVRYSTKPHTNYLVLTKNNLHYMYYQDGVVVDHLVFDRYRMLNMNVKEITNQDKIIYAGYIGSDTSHKLSFDIDGKTLEIVYQNRIYTTPDQEIISDRQDAISSRLLAQEFHEKILKANSQMAMA